MGFAIAAEVNSVLPLQKLVFIGRCVQGTHQLTGSSFVEINLEILVAGGTAKLPPIALNHLHPALLYLQHIANKEKLPIDGDGDPKQAGFIDIDLI